ncbi:WD repeat-containing protein 36-like [Argopecten irradians]|uniref:WD repeat-containing protein 36-like n=1 Tax=Argopecten irradians TaxID=31199 RepID=UPI00371A1CB1
MPVASKIFEGYRALGFVSNHVPLAVRYHKKHKDNYVVTCVGKSYHVYNVSKLGIVCVSDIHPDDINCIAVDSKFVFTGCKNVIRAYTRWKQLTFTYEGHEKDIRLLLPFGEHLVSVDDDSIVKVWDVDAEVVYMEMSFNNSTFYVTTLMHPSTYLNKILLGSKQGKLQLWNIRSDKMLYMFEGWNAGVTATEQSPAIDVVAIGLDDGQIILHNLKFDETVIKFRQDWGPVTSIGFRTDGHPVMVTGSAVGHMALWDLEQRKLSSQIREAHTTSVTGMVCVASEPLIVTSGADNSLKVWIMDLPDGGGRLLNQRSGHSAPPSRLCHYGNDGKNILSAGQDSTMRSFSTIHDKHYKSLGRASYNKTETRKTGLKKDKHMMPPVTQFVSESSRQSDWDNIVACHRGLCTATTWSYQRSTMGQHRFRHDRFNSPALQDAVAQAVDISSCGNFTVIAYSTGHVDKYNLQSGIHRGSYGEPTAHDCCVRGVAIDGLNQMLITAGGTGDIKFWKFKDRKLLNCLQLKSQISQICLHKESSMMAVSQDDFRILIVDIDTKRVVRTFSGHSNSVTDMTFSSDSRWLITSSMDCSVRTWDMPTGRLVDCFAVDLAVTTLSMSPTGDFLVTAHVDDIGVYLWSNLTLFSHVALKPLPADFEPHTLAMPATSKQTTGDVDEEEDEQTDDDVTEFKSPQQISDELVTLSLLPNSRWQNLLNLDTIRRRNKPKEPPKAPKAAPFFLPTVAGLEFKFAEAQADEEKDTSKIIKGNLQPLSMLGKALTQDAEGTDFEQTLVMMKKLGPSAIDIEVRSLEPDGGGSLELMSCFLSFICYVLTSRRDFELANAYLGLFLQVHGSLIAGEPKLVKELERVNEVQKEAWHEVQDLFTQNLCLVNYLRTATI